MSNDNTITEFPRIANQPTAPSLDDAIQAMSDWRKNKETRSEQIPDNIWKNIFMLVKKFPEATVCMALGITKVQLHKKREESNSAETKLTQPHESRRIDFCEVKQPSVPLYKAAKIPATNTLVVEFCRADGQIMKIHTTTDSFAELMKAFFTGA